MKMRSNIYNKNVLNPKGTLIGNWQEEYSLREFTGEGRSLAKTHIPKKGGDTLTDLKGTCDDTHKRIHGIKEEPLHIPYNREYGTGVNKADLLPTEGLKTTLEKKQIIENVKKEFEEKEKLYIEEKNKRYFDTSYKSEFADKIKESIEAGNTIGSKVMRTKDGIPIPPECRDEQFLVEHGLAKRKLKPKH